MRLTLKQQQLIQVLDKGNKDGSFCDLDQIIERLPYKTTKESLQFSIRALIAKGIADKAGSEVRRDRRHTLIMLTGEGRVHAAGLRVGEAPATVAISTEDDALLSGIDSLSD